MTYQKHNANSKIDQDHLTVEIELYKKKDAEKEKNAKEDQVLNVIIQRLSKVLSDSLNQTTQAISLKHNVRHNLITTTFQ